MEKYIVTLSPEEVEQLRSLVGKGKHAAQKVINALILLNCDQSQGRDDRRTSQEIAAVLQVSERKIDRVKRRFVEEGLEAALRQSTRALTGMRNDFLCHHFPIPQPATQSHFSRSRPPELAQTHRLLREHPLKQKRTVFFNRASLNSPTTCWACSSTTFTMGTSSS